MKKLNFLCSELSGTGGTETVLIKVLNHLVNKYEITLTLSNMPEEKEFKLENRIIKVKCIGMEKEYILVKILIRNKNVIFM